MNHYLYVPFKKKEVAFNQKKMIEEWLLLEERKKNGIIVCYFGDKKLKQLPKNTKISILLPGKPGKRSPLHGIEHVETETLRFIQNLSLHLRVTDEYKNSILIPEVADKMKDDGLLDEFQGRLEISLIYIDANPQEACIMTNSFLNSLKKYKEHEKGIIKLGYLTNDLENKANHHETFKKRKTKLELLTEKTGLNKQFMYNTKENYPKLSISEGLNAIKEYYHYKSSRCCNLSGLLNLNGFFSSTASMEAVKYLSDEKISDMDRYAYASRFIKYYKENHLSQFLRLVLENALVQHEVHWNNLSLT